MKKSILLPSVLVALGLGFSAWQLKAADFEPHEKYEYQTYRVLEQKEGSLTAETKVLEGLTIVSKVEDVKCDIKFKVGTYFHVKTVYVNGQKVRSLCTYKI